MKKGLKLTDDKDLQSRRDKDDYHVERIVKFTCAIAFVIVVTGLLIFFMVRVAEDQVFRDGVMDIMKQNLSGIVFMGISILGLNKFYKK